MQTFDTRLGRRFSSPSQAPLISSFVIRSACVVVLQKNIFSSTECCSSSASMTVLWIVKRCLLLLALGATPAPASFGKDIIFKSSDSGPANFSFSLPPEESSVLPFIVDPSGHGVFYLIHEGKISIFSKYENRIEGPQFKNGTVTFSLKNVTREDAGNYRCRKGSPTGPVIPDCGQRLRYIEDQNASEAPMSLPDLMTSVGSTLVTTDTGNTGSPSEPQTQNVGAIVGGVIGGVVLIVIGLTVGIVWWKRKKANAGGGTTSIKMHDRNQDPTSDDSGDATAGRLMSEEQIPQETRGNVSEPPEEKNEEEKPFFPRGEPSSSGTTQD